MVHCTNRQKHSKPSVYQSSQVYLRLYQQCTNNVPMVKNSQKQSKTVKNSQNSKNDHWCTNRHRFTKTVPTMYQQCTSCQKQSKTVKTQSKQHKMTIGVPVGTCLPRLYQPCTNSVPKTVKRQLKQQNDHWCTNRHRS